MGEKENERRLSKTLSLFTMIRHKHIRSQSFPLHSTSYPGTVITNNSLAGIDRVNKFYIPLHLYHTHVNLKQLPETPKTSPKVNIIPPISSTKVSSDQKGTGKQDNHLELMQHPIKVSLYH